MSAPSCRVAVLLVTRNGERYLPELLQAVRSQLPDGGRLVAVDSSSTDATPRLLAAHGATVVTIAPSEFGHGRTRNLAAETAGEDVDLLFFLTQDATPLPGWLNGLASTVAADARVAGAFSRHVPRPGCSPLLARRIVEEWPQVGGAERVVKSWAGAADAIPHAVAHFANTSSCVRRAVWARHRFPDVAFAEDVAWARVVLASGHRLVYEPGSAVLHSHDGSLWRQLRENVDHGRGMRDVLGPGRATAPSRHGAVDRARRDLAAIWRGDRPVAARLWWTAYAPAWYAASVAGQWLGRSSSRWPDRIVRRLSRQADLAASRR